MPSVTLPKTQPAAEAWGRRRHPPHRPGCPQGLPGGRTRLTRPGCPSLVTRPCRTRRPRAGPAASPAPQGRGPSRPTRTRVVQWGGGNRGAGLAPGRPAHTRSETPEGGHQRDTWTSAPQDQTPRTWVRDAARPPLSSEAASEPPWPQWGWVSGQATGRPRLHLAWTSRPPSVSGGMRRPRRPGVRARASTADPAGWPLGWQLPPALSLPGLAVPGHLPGHSAPRITLVCKRHGSHKRMTDSGPQCHPSRNFEQRGEGDHKLARNVAGGVRPTEGPGLLTQTRNGPY